MKESQGKIKVLYIVNGLISYGGIQRIISNKIDAWIDEFNYDVTLVTLNQNEKPIVFPPENSFKWIDLKLKKVNKHNIKDILRYIYLIRKTIRQESPSIILAALSGIPSLILPLIKPDVKKVLEIHSSGAFYISANWKYKWTFLNRYHKVVVLNEDEIQYYKLNNLIVIPNFVPVNDAIASDYKNRKKQIVAAGRIHPDKQYLHLVKAWEIVYNKYPDWNLEIYGNGDLDMLRSFQEYIEVHNIKRIRFNPATDKLEEVLLSSSLLCLTSNTDCFPMILIECKQYMLPVVSYDSPNGPRHIIKNDGILVEHNNIGKFAEEVGRLIENEELRIQLAENAYRNRALFSPSEIMKKWNELI